MLQALFQPRPFWINVNIVLFSGYAVFGIASFFLPSALRITWFAVPHFATLLVNIYAVYGLVRMRPLMNYLVAAVSLFMAVHLYAFLFMPLGMQLAYIGPSRAFYAAFLAFVSGFAGEKDAICALTAFNLVMLLVQIANILYFTKKAKYVARS